MFPKHFTKGCAASLLAFSLAAPFAPVAFAQKKGDRGQQDVDPLSRERKVKAEVKGVYKRWKNEDVAYIITDEERKAFDRLATDEEREQFIEAFWRRRDPDPDTDENEYREEYLERIAYANQHFASGIPGWKTDRGRIYITFGPPHGKESNPTGGSYDRPSYHGGGSTTTYPFEVWFYRHIEGVGSGIEIEFVDPTGTGEYRIARSPDEKDAMLNVPGAGLTLSEQLGLSSKADRLTGGYGGSNYSREQDNPFTRLQLLADLQRAPRVNLNTDLATTDTGTIEDNPLNFDVRVDYFRQSDDRIITAVMIQTENSDLTFSDKGGIQTAQLNIFGKIMSVAGRRVTTFEVPVVTTATVEDLAAAKNRKSAYQHAVSLPPGTYKLDLIVRDVQSGATGIRPVPLNVPKYAPDKLSTSTLVLASRLQAIGDQPAVGQFVIGNTKVIPNISGTYKRGEPVGLFMQIYNAQIDQTTLRPALEVEYVVMKDGKEVNRMKEDWRGMSDAGTRLTLARLMPTDGALPGAYEISVRIRDTVSSQTLTPSAKFTLTE